LRAARWGAEEISGDLFDLLIGLGDFSEFKALMLSFKDQVASERGASATGSGRPGAAPSAPPLLRFHSRSDPLLPCGPRLTRWVCVPPPIVWCVLL